MPRTPRKGRSCRRFFRRMSKNFLQNGKWIDNPHTVKVSVCSCGNKYIKTRPGQRTCIPCMMAKK